VPADHEVVPPDHDIVPLDHEVVPPDHDIIPLDHEVVPPDHDIVPLDHEVVPPDHDIVPLDHDIVPPDHDFSPAQGVNALIQVALVPRRLALRRIVVQATLNHTQRHPARLSLHDLRPEHRRRRQPAGPVSQRTELPPEVRLPNR
jgi:hypothetical protein